MYELAAIQADSHMPDIVSFFRSKLHNVLILFTADHKIHFLNYIIRPIGYLLLHPNNLMI